MKLFRKVAAASTVFAILLSAFTLTSHFESRDVIAAHVSANDRTIWAPAGNQTYATAVAPDGSVYYGGTFSQVAPYAPYGTPVSESTGLPKSIYAKPGGTVRAVVSDGQNGWYIGGDFTDVSGDTSIYSLAHITSEGRLDTSFAPNPNGAVYALFFDEQNNVLYVGGSFTGIAGEEQNYVASLNATTGTSMLNLDDPDGTVNTLLYDSMTQFLYIGGYFNLVGNSARSNLARINTGSGATDGGWHPYVDGEVKSIAIDQTNSLLYIGGSFTNINEGGGAVARSNLGAVSTIDTGTVVGDFDPSPSGNVHRVVLSDDQTTLYVGGEFTGTVGGATTRNYLGAFLTSDGTATSWNPNPNGAVFALSLFGSDLYVGGAFTSIGGGSRSRAAVIPSASNTATSWNPKPTDNVLAIGVDTDSGGYVYLAGEYMNIGLTTRSGIAHANADGTLDVTFNPAANGEIDAMVLDSTNNILYVGGTFTSIGGQSRNRIAALSTSTGLATSWNPNADGTVSSLLLDSSNSLLYVGGEFDNVGSAARARLAAVSTSTGLSTAWNPSLDGRVISMALSGTTLYVGGEFSTVGGNGAYQYLAAINTTTGSPLAWDPNPDWTVNAIQVNDAGDTVYVGGQFSNIGGQARSYLAALSASTGLATSWDATITGNYVNALQLDATEDTLYVGGHFSQIGGGSQSYLASVYTTDGTKTPWAPQVSTAVTTISYASSLLPVAVGGTSGFTTIDVDQLKIALYQPAAVSITESGGSTSVTEGGATDTYTVVLLSQPSVDVTVYPDSNLQVSLSPMSLTFTHSNWYVPQTVTVTAIDNSVAESTLVSNVTHVVLSNDLLFDSFPVSLLAVTVADNEVAGFTVGAISGDTSEDGDTATFTVVLTSQPTADVTIGVTSSDTGEGTVSPSSLTFTSGNWNTPQTVTVTGVDDATVDGNTAFNIILAAATSGDSAYNGLNPADVPVTNQDDDHASGGGSSTPVTPGPSPATSRVLTLTPNGGERLPLGTSLPISWSYSGRVDLVNVLLSRDAGATWETLAAGVRSGASPYTWTVSGAPTRKALVKIQATDLAQILSEDLSDDTFSIVDPSVPEEEPSDSSDKEADITEPILKDPYVAPNEPVERFLPSPVTGVLEKISVIMPGDFIRSPSFSTVYFVTKDLTRRPFLDEATFSTYADSFAVVKEVSDATLTILPVGQAMTPKAGKVLVKTPSDPKTYVVSETADGQALHWIVSEEAAVSIAGPAWADYVVDVPESVLMKYGVGEPVVTVTQTAIDPAKLRRRLDLKLQKSR